MSESLSNNFNADAIRAQVEQEYGDRLFYFDFKSNTFVHPDRRPVLPGKYTNNNKKNLFIVDVCDLEPQDCLKAAGEFYKAVHDKNAALTANAIKYIILDLEMDCLFGAYFVSVGFALLSPSGFREIEDVMKIKDHACPINPDQEEERGHMREEAECWRRLGMEILDTHFELLQILDGTPNNEERPRAISNFLDSKIPPNFFEV